MAFREESCMTFFLSSLEMGARPIAPFLGGGRVVDLDCLNMVVVAVMK